MVYLKHLGVALVAVPYTIARLLITSRLVRMATITGLAAYVSSRNYRKGEGIFTPKMPVDIIPIKEGQEYSYLRMGELLYSWGDISPVLAELRWKTISLTKSEAISLNLLIRAVQISGDAMPTLIDFLQNFPRLPVTN